MMDSLCCDCELKVSYYVCQSDYNFLNLNRWLPSIQNITETRYTKWHKWSATQKTSEIGTTWRQYPGSECNERFRGKPGCNNTNKRRKRRRRRRWKRETRGVSKGTNWSNEAREPSQRVWSYSRYNILMFYGCVFIFTYKYTIYNFGVPHKTCVHTCW